MPTTSRAGVPFQQRPQPAAGYNAHEAFATMIQEHYVLHELKKQYAIHQAQAQLQQHQSSRNSSSSGNNGISSIPAEGPQAAGAAPRVNNDDDDEQEDQEELRRFGSEEDDRNMNVDDEGDDLDDEDDEDDSYKHSKICYGLDSPASSNGGGSIESREGSHAESSYSNGIRGDDEDEDDDVDMEDEEPTDLSMAKREFFDVFMRLSMYACLSVTFDLT